MIGRILSIGVGVLIFASPSFADPVSLNSRPRMEMMGGAGLATKGDKDSAMMNPAGLDDIEGWEVQMFPLLIEVPFELDVLNAGLDYKDDSDKSADIAQPSLQKLLEEAGSSSYKARINLYPSFTMKRFHIGLLLEALADADFRVGGVGSGQLVQAGDTAITAGLIAGGAWAFMDDSLQVGVTLKPLARNAPLQYQDQQLIDVAIGENPGDNISVSDQLFGEDPQSRTTFGVGIDLGLKYKLEKYSLAESHWWSRFVEQFKPAVGLTYQDIGDTRFFSNDPTPRDIPQSISAGMAIHPSWAFVDTTFALDFRNLNEKKDLLNKVHMGAEAVLWNIWAIRAGFGQAYLSGGMGLSIPFFEIEAYVAAQEAGEYARLDDERVIGLRISAKL